MIALTLEQLRATQHAGGVAAITLEATGAAFVVAITARTGGRALLVARRGKTPRRFADPRKALRLLYDMGLRTVGVDMKNWSPAQRDIAYSAGTTQALRESAGAAATDLDGTTA